MDHIGTIDAWPGAAPCFRGMRQHVIWAALGLAIGILAAGAPVAAAPSSASVGPRHEPPTSYQLDDVTIGLSRTGCFGSCPIY